MTFSDAQIQEKIKEQRRAYYKNYYKTHKAQRKEYNRRAQERKALLELQTEAEKKEDFKG